MVIAGLHVAVEINGQQIGQVTSLEWTRTDAVRVYQGIDQLQPAELIRGAHTIAGQIGLVRTRGDGGEEGIGLAAPIPDLSQEQYVSIVLRDVQADTILFQVEQSLVTSSRWAAVTRDIMKGQISFIGIRSRTSVRARRS